MASSIKLEFHLDPDPSKVAHGELVVNASCGSFSGKSSAWFTCADLKRFGQSLRDTFPIPTSQPLLLAGGQFDITGTVLEQMQIRLRVYPLGGAGVLAILVELSTGIEFQRQRSVRLGLETNYEELRRFGSAVTALAEGAAFSAELSGDN